MAVVLDSIVFPLGTFGSGNPRLPNLWTPAQIATELWFSYADTASLVLSGNRLTQWSDKSGKVRHIVQSTVADQPTNNNGIQFDGLTQQLSTGSPFTISSTVNTFFLVERNLNGVTGAAPYSFSPSTPVSGIVFQSNFGMQTLSQQNSSIPYNQANVRILSISQGTPISGFVDGVNTIVSSISDLGAYTSTDFSIGRRIVSNIYTSGTVLEAIVVAGMPTDNIRQRIEGYAAYIYSSQARLAANHPYKNSPPTI